MAARFSLLIFISLLFTPLTLGLVITGPSHPPLCRGSIKLLTQAGQVAVVREVERSVKIVVTRAVVEGCGCYQLFERRNYRGRTYHARRTGEHQVGLRKVKSVRKIPCFMWFSG